MLFPISSRIPLSPALSLQLAAKLHHIFLGLQAEHFPVIPCKLGNAHVPLLRQLLDRKGIAEIFLDPAAVSYTHLDVYKRQVSEAMG